MAGATSSTCRSAIRKTSPRSAYREPAGDVGRCRWTGDSRASRRTFLQTSPSGSGSSTPQQRRVPAHAEPLGGLRQLPPRGAERRGHVVFACGPRDNLTNAGGLLDTGFLRTPIAVRSRITANDRHGAGGHFDIDQASEAAAGRARELERGDPHARPAVHRRRSRDPGQAPDRPARRGGGVHGDRVRPGHSGPAKTDSGAAILLGSRRPGRYRRSRRGASCSSVDGCAGVDRRRGRVAGADDAGEVRVAASEVIERALLPAGLVEDRGSCQKGRKRCLGARRTRIDHQKPGVRFRPMAPVAGVERRVEACVRR